MADCVAAAAAPKLSEPLATADPHLLKRELFGAFFDKPEFRKALLDYLAGSYAEIRSQDAS